MEKDNTFSPEYNLDSTTGYCMPFKGTDAVKVTTHYGESLQDETHRRKRRERDAKSVMAWFSRPTTTC